MCCGQLEELSRLHSNTSSEQNVCTTSISYVYKLHEGRRFALLIYITVNLEIFVVEIFSSSMLCTKIKRTKLKRMSIINVNVLGKGSFVRKLHKTKIYCAKYF